MKYFTPQIHKAINIAATKHKDQERKVRALPYIVHPFAVALILMEYTDNQDIIIAGILHDTVEDTDYSKEDIEKDFNPQVAKLVMDVTERDKDLPWQKRKEDYLAHLKTTCFESKLICAADKIHNLQSAIEAYKLFGKDTDKHFNAPPDKKLWFYEQCLKTCKNEARMPSGIIKEFQSCIDSVKSTINSQ